MWSSWAVRPELSSAPVQRCLTPTKRIRLIRDGEPWATSTFTQLLSSDSLFIFFSFFFQCCFTSTETIRTIKDGETRTATSTFTQLLNSDSIFILFLFFPLLFLLLLLLHCCCCCCCYPCGSLAHAHLPRSERAGGSDGKHPITGTLAPFSASLPSDQGWALLT